MANGPSIRPASESDLPSLLAIYNDVIRTTTAVFSYQPHTLAMREEWYAAKRAAGHPVLVAEGGGIILGFAALGPFRAWPAYKYSLENSIYVAPEARGRGVGGHLLSALLAEARRLEVHTVIASIEATNSASLALHARHGFREVARFREVGYKFGRWLDLVFMQLLFDLPEHPVEE
jgi:phosphinothricin acetyltransferase